MAVDSEIVLRVRAEMAGAVRDLQRLTTQVEELRRQNERLSQNRFDELRQNLASVAAGYLSIQTALDAYGIVTKFETAMDSLGSKIGATAEELEKLEATALEMGEASKYSATEAANAMDFLAAAGFSTNEIIKSIPATLNLAAAGNLELAEASDIASNSLNSFDLKVEDMTHLTDVMAKTVNQSSTDLRMLGESFKNVAPVATSLGVGVEETSAALGVLADNGIKAERAGTALKIVLSRIATDKQAKEVLEELGISAYDASGNFRGLGAIMQDLQGKLGGLSEQAKQETFVKIFGSEALASGIVLTEKVETLTKRTKELSEVSGEAARLAKEQSDNQEGMMDALSSAYETLVIQIGKELLPIIAETTKSMTDFIKSLTSGGEMDSAVTAITGIASALGAVVNAVSMLNDMAMPDILGGEDVGLLKVVAAGLGVVADGYGKIGKVVSDQIDVMKRADEVQERLLDAEKIKQTVDNYDMLEESYKEISENIKVAKDENQKLAKSFEGTYSADASDAVGKLNAEMTKLNALSDELESYPKAFEEATKTIPPVTEKVKELKAVVDTLTLNGVSIKIDADTTPLQFGIEKMNTLINEQTGGVTLTVNPEYAKAEAEIKAFLERQKTDMLTKNQEAYTAMDAVQKAALDKRIADTNQTLTTIAQQETNLHDTVVSLNEQFATKMEALDNQRLGRMTSIEDRIRQINQAGMSDYQIYIDTQAQAQEKLALAKEAMLVGDLEKYKLYIQQYEALAMASAGKEIELNGQVKISKDETAQKSIEALNTIKEMENQYYETRRMQEAAAHEATLAQKRIEIDMMVQQLQAQREIAVAQAQAQNIQIDTTKIDVAIGRLNELKGNLDTIKATKTPVDTETGGVDIAKVKVDELKELTIAGTTLEVTAETEAADFGIKSMIQNIEGEKVELILNPEYSEAQKKIEEFRAKQKGEAVDTKVTADTAEAERKLSDFKKIDIQVTSKVGADTTPAQEDVKNFISIADASSATTTLKADAREAFAAKDRLIQPTSSVHTIYVKTVAAAMGGFIPSFAGGGQTFSGSGKVAGYDPTDSDSVQARVVPNSFVMKRTAVQKYGTGAMQRLAKGTNAMLTRGEFVLSPKEAAQYDPRILMDINAGKLQKFADGGFTSTPSPTPSPTSVTVDVTINNPTDINAIMKEFERVLRSKI